MLTFNFQAYNTFYFFYFLLSLDGVYIPKLYLFHRMLTLTGFIDNQSHHPLFTNNDGSQEEESLVLDYTAFLMAVPKQNLLTLNMVASESACQNKSNKSYLSQISHTFI